CAKTLRRAATTTCRARHPNPRPRRRRPRRRAGYRSLRRCRDERRKAKGKRQRAKVRTRFARGVLIYFCLLPFAFRPLRKQLAFVRLRGFTIRARTGGAAVGAHHQSVVADVLRDGRGLSPGGG